MASKGLQKYSGKHVAIAERIPGIGIHLPGVVGFWLRMAGEVPIILDCACGTLAQRGVGKMRAGILIGEPDATFERLLPGDFPGRGLPGSGK